MYKIGVIGDRDSIMSFKAMGISVFPVKSSEEAVEVLHKLAERQFAVIYITEQIAREIPDAIYQHSESKLPAIILIPGNQGVLGIGMDSVRKSVERAVGADILFNKE